MTTLKWRGLSVLLIRHDWQSMTGVSPGVTEAGGFCSPHRLCTSGSRRTWGFAVVSQIATSWRSNKKFPFKQKCNHIEVSHHLKKVCSRISFWLYSQDSDLNLCIISFFFMNYVIKLEIWLFFHIWSSSLPSVSKKSRVLWIQKINEYELIEDKWHIFLHPLKIQTLLFVGPKDMALVS